MYFLWGGWMLRISLTSAKSVKQCHLLERCCNDMLCSILAASLFFFTTWFWLLFFYICLLLVTLITFLEFLFCQSRESVCVFVWVFKKNPWRHSLFLEQNEGCATVCEMIRGLNEKWKMSPVRSGLSKDVNAHTNTYTLFHPCLLNISWVILGQLHEG